MIVQVYTYEDGYRYVIATEYADYLQWEKDLMILKFQGLWVGHKIFADINLADFNELTETERNNMDTVEAIFDKESYIKQYLNQNGKHIIHQSKLKH